MNYTDELSSTAKKITKHLENNPDIKAIFISGSVGREIADEYSDIELFIVWKKSTNLELRESIFKNIHHENLGKEYDEGGGEWVKAIIVDKIKVDIYHWELQYVENLIKDITQELNTSITRQLSTSSILDAKVLFGKEYIESLKSTFSTYSESYAKKIIKKESFFESWSLRNALLARQDYIALHTLINRTTIQLLRLLFAINKVYLRSHNFKWIKYQLTLISIKPEDLESRLNRITSDNSSAAINELDKLINETIDITQREFPTLNLINQLEHLKYLREPRLFNTK